MCDTISAPWFQAVLFSVPVLPVAEKAQGLSVWAPESRPFPALHQLCSSLWTLLPECPRPVSSSPHLRCTALLTKPFPWPLIFTPLSPTCPLQALCFTPHPAALSPCFSSLHPALVVTAIPELGTCQDRTFLEDQSFPPRILFLLEAQRGAQAGQGHTAADCRVGLLTSNLGLLGPILKCLKTCPSTLLPGLSWMVQSSLAGLSFTRMTYLLDRKEIIKCK